MTRDETIDNMAELMCDQCKNTNCIEDGPCDEVREQATVLYEAGYRYCGEDEMVTLEWHNEQILHAESEIDYWKKRVTELLLKKADEIAKVKEKNVELEWRNERLRKQVSARQNNGQTAAVIKLEKIKAAQDFAEKIKAELFDWGYIVHDEDVDEILERYENDNA